jgi:glucosamine--fructose-6-phosphate aminotransferase (isomerizing)
MTNPPGFYTRQEILSQPEAWEDTLQTIQDQSEELKTFFAAGNYTQVLFTGCGSTYYLSMAAAASFQQLTGLPARSFPASELWLNKPASYPAAGKILLVAISRSGLTSETLAACKDFLASRRGDLVTLSCYAAMPLAQMGQLNFILSAGAEQSIAQTRAFTSLFLASLAVSALWAGQDSLLDELSRLPAVAKKLLAAYAPIARQIGQNRHLERFYFLGSGARYGLACELSLKMKEMSLSHSEPFHFLEFRHGPKSMVTHNTLIFGLVSAHNREREMAVLDEMKALGAQILALGEDQPDIPFQSNLSEAARDVLYLPVGQLIAFERSLDKGLDPDNPHQLSAVVTL